jgi:hypothetical protein
MIVSDLETHLEYAVKLFDNSRGDMMGTIPPNMNDYYKYSSNGRRQIPYHLHYDIQRIASEYKRRGYISKSDEAYLKKVYTQTDIWLCSHVYVLGKWWAYSKKKPKTHNILTKRSYRR